MLKTQEYLRSGKSLEDLNKELAIEITRHPSLPLAILNYNQIESPKTHPIVRECRALTLNTEDWNIVAKSFNRFYNWGEVVEEMALFQWDKATAAEKVDGSLVTLYYFDGEWRANTRGSFGFGSIIDNEWKAKAYGLPQTFSWQDAFCRALGLNSIRELEGKLDPSCTYVCEFCSLWNKVVREYPEPCMYLLTRFVGEEEIGPDDNPLFRKLTQYSLRTAEDVQNFCNDHPEATFEGIVAFDGKARWKLKNPRYVALHHIRGNDNIWHPKYALSFILKGEADELITYFPEATEVIREQEDKVNSAYKELESLWAANWQIENQKEFALSIVGKTPFTGILFNLRKRLGKSQTVKDLRAEWRDSGDYILKVLY